MIRALAIYYNLLQLCFLYLRSFGNPNDALFRLEVTEESPVGTLINGASEYLNQLRTTRLKSSDGVKFRLLEDGSVSRLLNLNPNHGLLRVSGRIDREDICPDVNNAILSTQNGANFGFMDSNKAASKMLFMGDSSNSNECVQPLNILLISSSKSSDDGSPRTVRVMVQLLIRDVNDNAPSWPQHLPLQVSFVETPSLGVSWSPMSGSSSAIISPDDTRNAKTIERALDPDMGPNGTVVYRLLGPGAEYFRLEDRGIGGPNGNPTSTLDFDESNKYGEDGSYHRPLMIWPVVPLDRETEEFAGRGGLFNLTLLASDLGTPPKTSSTTLLIFVTDVNDHAPVFHNGMYAAGGGKTAFGLTENNLVLYRPPNGNVRETVPVGSFILQLNATDRDSGAHSKVTYEFCPCDRNVAWDYFKIDQISGRISVAKRLDYDNGPRRFQFKVIAKDGAPEPYTLTGTAMVEITLADENDETPEISVMLLHASGVEFQTSPLINSPQRIGDLITPEMNGAKFLGEYVTSINENPQPETVIAYIQVIDRDHHGQDQVHCRLGPTDNFTLQVDTVGSHYDSSRSDFSVPASENLNLAHRQDFRLVTGTSMTDLNGPYNRLDREISPMQQITLTCTDSVGNSAYVLIKVHLIDVNDHAPEFISNGHFVFQIPENQELVGGKPIWLGRTIASDKDHGENALITYRLSDDESWFEMNKDVVERKVKRLFELDPQTGDLYAKTVFDRETAPSGGAYRIRVYASDGGTPKLTGTATVEIFILDVNDWAPQFTRDVYTFGVSEDTRVQEIIGAVEAIDRDADSQGKITYRIINPSHPRTVSSDELRKRSVAFLQKELEPKALIHSGVNLLRTQENSTFRENASVKPVKTSNRLNRLKRQTNVSLDISQGINNVADSQNREKTENRLLKSSTTGLEQTNSFEGFTQLNLGSLQEPVNYFSVDRLSGKIRLIRRLDRESVAFLSIEILAVDAPPVSIVPLNRHLSGAYSDSNWTSRAHTQVTQKSLSSTTTVVIAVTDVNDNSPVFRRPNTSTAIQLRLHETLGRQLLIAEATDADEGDNARVTYYIRSEVPRPAGGPGTGYFAIDETSGVLFLAKTLNNTATHRLVIEACDNASGLNRRCSLSPSIRITVFDGVHYQEGSSSDLSIYPSRASQTGQSELPFDLDALTARSAAAAQASRRNELVVVALVIIFSLLLLATILLVACLVHKRGARTWFIGRPRLANRKSRGKDANKSKVQNNSRMGTSPWLDGTPMSESNELTMDAKFESGKPVQYDVGGLTTDAKYLSQDALASIGYTNVTPGYSLVSTAMINGPPNFALTNQLDRPIIGSVPQLAPAHPRHFGSPTLDNSQAAFGPNSRRVFRRIPQNSDTNELLTQSSYKPPSPDYQSLDTMWGQYPGPEIGLVRGVHTYRNPITSSSIQYAVDDGVAGTEPPIFLNTNPNGGAQTLPPHTYYEIATSAPGSRDMWQTRRTQLFEMTEPSEMGGRSYSQAATLGRPATGKGKRRMAVKDDSMHNLQAGELAIHKNKKSTHVTNRKEERTEESEVKSTQDNSAAYAAKSNARYTYQAYREGTFV
ncbi:unnamed protein product [Calicophoron daubneyi]|uniref:Cadherin domain-containing protein n=1 Tax=Calicophoron daubneyi TaxID=300641 RepID=A0AAV2T0Z8_CALDB